MPCPSGKSETMDIRYLKCGAGTGSERAIMGTSLKKVAKKTKEYKYQAPQKNEFTIEKVGEHEFVVKGEQLERLVQMTNLDHQDGIMRLARRLKRLGVDDALREKGAVNGDDVAIGKFVFEFVQ